MKKNGKKKVSAIKNNLYFLKLVWQISPAAVILNFFTNLLGFASWAFYSVFFLQYLFGAAGARKFSDILIFIWAAAVIGVLINIYNAWFYQSYMYREYIKIGYRLNLKLFKRRRPPIFPAMKRRSFTIFTPKRLPRLSRVPDRCLITAQPHFARLYPL